MHPLMRNICEAHLGISPQKVREAYKQTHQDYFGNSIEKMKQEHYAWAIETLSDCADSLNVRDLKELINDLKIDPLYIMQAVIRRMEADLQQRIEDDNLCPKCLVEMQTKYRTCVSNGWNEPPGSWEEPDRYVCPQCGREG